MLHTLVLVLGLVAFSQDPGNPSQERELTYLFQIAEQEVGREEVKLLADGWEARGRYDLFGTRKAEYEARTSQDEGGAVRMGFRVNPGAEDQRFEAVLAEGKVRYPGLPENDRNPLELSGKNPRIFYENFLWACFIDLGRELVRLGGDEERSRSTAGPRACGSSPAIGSACR